MQAAKLGKKAIKVTVMSEDRGMLDKLRFEGISQIGFFEAWNYRRIIELVAEIQFVKIGQLPSVLIREFVRSLLFEKVSVS